MGDSNKFNYFICYMFMTQKIKIELLYFKFFAKSSNKFEFKIIN